MKKMFPHYFSLEKNVLDSIWNNGIIILDASVLLELYRYSNKSRESFLSILAHKKITHRLWLPYHAAEDFLKSRLAVIMDQTSQLKNIEEVLNKTSSELITKIKKTINREENPIITKNELMSLIKSSFKEINQNITDRSGRHPDLQKNDHILKTLEELFAERTGEKPKDNILNQYKAEVDEKIKFGISFPGLCDRDKKGESKYNDYYIWKEIIDKSKLENKSVIFVTNDVKTDWWLKIAERTIGIHYENRKQFIEESGNEIVLYTAKHFVESADSFLNMSEESQEGKNRLEALLKEMKNISIKKEFILNAEKNYSKYKDENYIKKFSALIKPGKNLSIVDIYEKILLNEYLKNERNSENKNEKINEEKEENSNE